MAWRPGTLELARDQASAAGIPFIVARASKTLLEMVERRFESRPEVPSWPSASTRQCTSDLKRGPIQREGRRYAKANGYKVVVNCLGLRAEESPGRARRNEFSQMGISNSVLTWYEWLVVHDMKTEEVFSTITAAGQTPHYAYAQGNERLNGQPMTTRELKKLIFRCEICERRPAPTKRNPVATYCKQEISSGTPRW